MYRKNVAIVGVSNELNSYFARAISEKLKMDFIDLKTHIEMQFKQNVNQMISNNGFEYYLNAIKMSLNELSETSNNKLFCFDGAILFDLHIVEYLRQFCYVFIIKINKEDYVKLKNSINLVEKIIFQEKDLILKNCVKVNKVSDIVCTANDDLEYLVAKLIENFYDEVLNNEI